MVAASLKSNGRTRTALDRFLGTLLTASLVLAVSQCGDSTEPPTPTSISLSSTSVSLDALGATQQLTGTVLDQFRQPFPGSTVTWSSSDVAVASVNGTGLVTAAGNGSAQITASSGTLSSSATVTVAQVVSQLQKTAGDVQTGTVGTALAVALQVQANDRLSNPVAGQTINFAVVQGGGSVSAATGTTDASGRASTIWTLDMTAGTNHQVDATHANVATPASFTATADADVAASVAQVSGDAQSGASGTPLPESIVVNVTDQFGNAVSGQTVTFSVTAGGGSVSPASTATDATGGAATAWTMGALGANTLQATVGGLAPVAFSATSVLGPPTIISASAGDNQTAPVSTAVANPPAVLVTDAGMNPISGEPVAFEVASGGGSITGPNAITDVNGIAAAGSWTLGMIVGTNTLTATVTGLSAFTFSAIGTGPADNLTINAGDNQTGLVGFALNVNPSVLVADAAGTGLSGLSVAFAETLGGGSVTGSPATTDASGIATVGSWVLGAGAGANTMTATVTGLTPVTFTATAATASYDIEVRFLTGTMPTGTQMAAFASAEARWETLIFGELSDIPLDVPAPACVSFPNTPAINETIDDLLILVEFVAIDGPGSVLAQAGPCFIRTADNLSVLGAMSFDTADLPALEMSGELEVVILHEIAHVVGFGALWGLFGFLVNPSVPGMGGVDTHFTGPQAIAAFDEIGGTAYTAGDKVPVENSGVAGSADGHWRELALKTELMTPFLDLGMALPLARVTTASMLDLGYQANLAASDALMLTFPFTLPAGRGPLELKDDIIWGPIYVVDRSGNVVGVIHR